MATHKVIISGGLPLARGLIIRGTFPASMNNIGRVPRTAIEGDTEYNYTGRDPNVKNN